MYPVEFITCIFGGFPYLLCDKAIVADLFRLGEIDGTGIAELLILRAPDEGVVFGRLKIIGHRAQAGDKIKSCDRFGDLGLEPPVGWEGISHLPFNYGYR